jgi:hypothetical protein
LNFSRATELVHNTAMLRLLFCGLALLVASLSWAQNESSGRATYSWVDEKGMTHYGDSVPPQYAKTERLVRNRQGVAVARLEAEKTIAQIAEERRQRELVEQEQQRDRFLLTTYTSVRDIEQLREARLEQIADQRRSTEGYVDMLANRLEDLQLQAQAFRPYSEAPNARRMPDRLAEELVRTINEMRAQRTMLDTRRVEEEDLRAKFQSDIDRYRTLRSGLAETR